MDALAIVFSVLFIVVLAVCIALWLLTVKSQSPKKTEGSAVPAFPYDKISFTSSGSQIAGWFISNRDNENLEKKPVVILAHGWASSKSRMLRYAETLYKEGYALLLYDARSHGESESIKAPTVKSFRDDLLAAVRFAMQREEADPDRVAVLAHSFGGFGGVLALKETDRIKALVTDSMPAQFDTIMKAYLSRSSLKHLPLAYFLLRIGFWRAGISRKEVKRFDPVSILKQTSIPVLLLHSKKDDYVPVTELDYLVSQLPGVSHQYLHTSGHRNSHKDPDFWNSVLPFLRRHLQQK
ncbi:alpha/beta hydrolase [Paenibacillus thermotolerans]|uniref:alpha/beta hydrolase n=1 Tax=Paenibacillus thermotolerans TaxID=3027807 RepID=UPI002367462D|nr:MULTISPECIES: alpha/beta fold hydrolase [unclassified Paenibacillus]